MNFKIVDFTNPDDWHNWRKTGIGSSDAPVIMGVSRFKDYDTLLLEKAGLKEREKVSNFAIERGNRIEPLVRKLYENIMGIEFPAVSCQSIEQEYLKSSLDGLDSMTKSLMIEIKLLTTAALGKRNEKTPGYQKWLDVKNNNKIPEDYYPQLQHQMMVTGLPACVFIGLRETRGFEPKEEDLAITTVQRDDSYIATLKYKSMVFWKEVQKLKGEKDDKDSSSTGT